jgi:hypothetical protein
MALVLAALAGGCGDDRSACEISQEKLDQCNAELASRPQLNSFQGLPLQTKGECSGVNACVAACVNATSCATLDYSLRGGRYDPNRAPAADAGTFLDCLLKCRDL